MPPRRAAPFPIRQWVDVVVFRYALLRGIPMGLAMPVLRMLADDQYVLSPGRFVVPVTFFVLAWGLAGMVAWSRRTRATAPAAR